MSIFNFLREVGFIFFSYFFVLAILLGGRLTPDVSYLNSMRSFYKKKSKNRHALNSCSLASSIRPGAQLWLLQIPCSYKPCPVNKMPLWPHSGRRHQLKSPLYPFFFTQKKKKKILLGVIWGSAFSALKAKIFVLMSKLLRVATNNYFLSPAFELKILVLQLPKIFIPPTSGIRVHGSVRQRWWGVHGPYSAGTEKA